MTENWKRVRKDYVQEKGNKLEVNLGRRSKDTACKRGTYCLLTETLGRNPVDIFNELGARRLNMCLMRGEVQKTQLPHNK